MYGGLIGTLPHFTTPKRRRDFWPALVPIDSCELPRQGQNLYTFEPKYPTPWLFGYRGKPLMRFSQYGTGSHFRITTSHDWSEDDLMTCTTCPYGYWDRFIAQRGASLVTHYSRVPTTELRYLGRERSSVGTGQYLVFLYCTGCSKQMNTSGILILYCTLVALPHGSAQARS